MGSFPLEGFNQPAFALKKFQTGLNEADRAVPAPVFGGDPDSVVAVFGSDAGLQDSVG